MAELEKLPLDSLWRPRAKKFGDFAGYDMPLEFEGLIAEHNWTRTHAGLFDVSHMGPCFLNLREHAGAKHEDVAAIVERLVPADIKALKPGQVRYTTLVNAEGGTLDDLMIARTADDGLLHIVVNASMKGQDFALIAEAAGAAALLVPQARASLIALQGPEAVAVLTSLIPGVAAMRFMTLRRFDEGERFGILYITRSGYTGEDGFEILVQTPYDLPLAGTLLADARVKPIGLGARDSLRLEAGLCLYGHELDPAISPIEADLAWTIQKRRREAGDFPGAARILRELREGPSRKRVGIRPRERAPARDGVEIQKYGRRIGVVTSGGFSPTLNAPISMGYVEAAFANPGTSVDLIVRGQARAADIVPLPFVPHRYQR